MVEKQGFWNAREFQSRLITRTWCKVSTVWRRFCSWPYLQSPSKRRSPSPFLHSLVHFLVGGPIPRQDHQIRSGQCSI
ncbi:uncharacterized protein CCOS01_05886 [Colletotrichum costaricense]|uniref:Uncharacterized protein n=2 Tax=Colletotrichum acutatum species complex TaxID=2707335 RepID=A0AAI9Z1B7_9PEZI|nr:uncharacterized protein CCOS01_05886 [Colletotrichum costaricense]XP_060388254.1 uncharacterized protein CTAM01_00744 [Colletotrichum tamarilloi]KAI3529332.1 hypothetical protein CSPX01_15577 [Colletotrichum filicis]KAK1511814.1 hypothetical protein CTAM01_00744 [Colletotrichum tamarilloi]KAK1530783.1 hypothetical protein CCOS01_05886 [Colletotrichum costaricense]